MSNHPPDEVTTLAHLQLNGGDEVTVELHRPSGLSAVSRTVHPAVVVIVWPSTSTIIRPKEFGDAAAALVKLFSEAHVELARIRAYRPGVL